MTKWISVKDRLPNDMDRVAFVAISQHDYLNGKTFGGVYNKPNDLFCMPGLGLIATHWMPLPDAPKESNDE